MRTSRPRRPVPALAGAPSRSRATGRNRIIPLLAVSLLTATTVASRSGPYESGSGFDAGPAPAPGAGARIDGEGTHSPAPAAESAAAWLVAVGNYEWSFPRDHRAHEGYRIEWWYFTGHLEADDDPARRFGYQFTIFRIGLLPRPVPFDSAWSAGDLLMGHAALTDETGPSHRFSEVLYRAAPLLAGFGAAPDPVIARTRAPAGTDDEWSLRWNGEAFDLRMRDDRRGFSLDLVTAPVKPLVLQGPNGFSRKSEAAGAASLYYSFTRLATSGTVALDGRTWHVHGASWMDKEFSSSQLGADQVGWNWFGLQLDDGREIMLYELRDADGRVDHARGTLVDTLGQAVYLEGDDWTTRALGTWRSPESGIVYPSGWSVDVPAAGTSLVLEPVMAGQENRSSLAGSPIYWEGAVVVRDAGGAVVGRGYVELTGYGEGNRPPV